MKLNSRVMLVTGSSKGIGAAIAIEAARAGANVIVNYHADEEGARQTLQSIEESGTRGLMIKADVSRKEDVDRMIEEGIRKLGKIDLLVNNCGIALWKPFLESDEENWDRTLDINLKSVYLCSQAVAKSLVAAQIPGCIINISSIAAYGSLDCLVSYCAAKGGMTLATKAIAKELAPYGIRVNAIAPGTIDVERNRATDPRFPTSWLPYIPLGRVGSPEEIAKPVIFLCSEDA